MYSNAVPFHIAVRFCWCFSVLVTRTLLICARNIEREWSCARCRRKIAKMNRRRPRNRGMYFQMCRGSFRTFAHSMPWISRSVITVARFDPSGKHVFAGTTSGYVLVFNSRSKTVRSVCGRCLGTCWITHFCTDDCSTQNNRSREHERLRIREERPVSIRGLYCTTWKLRALQSTRDELLRPNAPTVQPPRVCPALRGWIIHRTRTRADVQIQRPHQQGRVARNVV